MTFGVFGLMTFEAFELMTFGVVATTKTELDDATTKTEVDVALVVSSLGPAVNWPSAKVEMSADS